MARSIKMPELGESITEGTITRWLKREGDQVEADEPLFEVSTDKVDTEVPSPVAGVLTSIKVKEDETVAVGTELAEIEPADAAPAGTAETSAGAPGAQAGASKAEPEAEAEAPQAQAEAPQAEAPEAEAPEAEAPEATEATRAEAPDAEAEAQPEAPEAEAAASGGGAAPDGGASFMVRMPELGESITEGTITRWLKREGDQVQADEPLFEVSTDKVDTEVPSPVAGVVASIKVREDDTVGVGAELVEIATGAGGGGDSDGDGRGAVPEGMVVSPLVRRLAREHGIDLSQIRGSGAGGRVRREDVEAYLEQGATPTPGTPAPTATAPATPRTPTAPATPAPAATTPATAAGAQAPATGAPAGSPGLQVAVPLPAGVREEVVRATRTRRLIAERMVTSLQVSAQLTTAVEVDMTRVMRLRERAKDAFRQREGVSLSPLPFCVQAMIAAVRQYPNLNSAMDGDGNLHVYKDVNLGVAVDTPKGLFVPVIKHADTLNLAGLAKAIADVAGRTRDGRISPDELSGSTITVTNTGSRGAVWDTPIINQPNAAVFATPAILRRPAVIDDPDLGEVVAVRHQMYAIVTYDHRIVDGADAARFLVKVKEVLEEADFAAELGLS